MNKKIKKTLSIFSLSLISITPTLTILSADPEPGTPPAPEPQPPKVVSPVFDTFDNIASTEFKQALRAAISSTVDKLNSEINKISQDQSISFEERFKKLHYFARIIHFLQTNTDQIISNPEQFGINAVFLKALSKNRKNNRGTITYDGEDFSNIIFGTNSDTNYDNLVDKKEDIKIEENQQDNTVSKEEFTQNVDDYKNNLLNKFSSFLYDSDEDIPPMSKEDLKTLQSTQDNGFTLKPPKDFTSWDDYLKSKLKKRYTKFDLEQNKNQQKEEEQQPPQENTPPSLGPIAPPVNGESEPGLPPKPTPVNPLELSTKVPDLLPEIKSQFIGLPLEDIQKSFTNEANREGVEIENVSDKYFFFNNPINTRHRYIVTKLERGQATGEFVFTVQLKDNLQPNITRNYTKSTNNNEQANKTESTQKLLEQYVLSANQLFKKFYNSVGIGENMDYDKLKNSPVFQNSIYVLLDIATKIINDEQISNKENTSLEVDNKDVKFSEKQNQILENYKNTDFDSDSSLQTPVNQLLNYLISALKNQQVQLKNSNQTPVHLFQLLTLANKSSQTSLGFYNELLFTQFATKSKERFEDIKKKFDYYHQNISILENLFIKIQKDVFIANNFASQKTFNYINWFNNFSNLLKKVTKEYDIFTKLTTIDGNASKYATPSSTEAQLQADEETNQTNQNASENKESSNINDEDQDTKNFKNQVEDYYQIMKESQKTKSPSMYIIGILMSLLGFISLGFASFFKFFNKFTRNKTISKSMVILIIFSVAILALGVLLIALGFTGGLI